MVRIKDIKIHPREEIEICKKDVCYKIKVDKEIVDLVKSINNFKKDNEDQFETVLSDQEDITEGNKYFEGGETYVDLNYMTNQSEKYLSDVLNDAAKKLIDVDTSCKKIELRKDFASLIDEKSQRPIYDLSKRSIRVVQPNVTLDCKVPNFKIGNERKIYLTNRKAGIKILTDSFNKLSEKIKT